MFCLSGSYSKAEEFSFVQSQHLLHTAWSHQIKPEKTHSCPSPSTEMLKNSYWFSWGCLEAIVFQIRSPASFSCLETLLHIASPREVICHCLQLPWTVPEFAEKVFPSETGSPPLAVGLIAQLHGSKPCELCTDGSSWSCSSTKCCPAVTTGFVPGKENPKPEPHSLCHGSIFPEYSLYPTEPSLDWWDFSVLHLSDSECELIEPLCQSLHRQLQTHLQESWQDFWQILLYGSPCMVKKSKGNDLKWPLKDRGTVAKQQQQNKALCQWQRYH